MKLGISAFAWTAKFDHSHLYLVPMVKEMGFSALEIAMFDPADLAIGAIRREFERSGLACTVCAILPPGINPISPDAGARSNAVQHLRRCIEAAAELGAGLICGPVYAPIGYLPEHRPTPDEWGWAVEALQSIGDALDACNVTLAIEPVNRAETFFLRTGREARLLCEVIGHPRVGVTIDTFHGNIEERDLPGAIASLGPHLRHLHFSENDRSLLGAGHVDFPGIVAALRSVDYEGYLMIEGFGYSARETSGPGVLWADMSVSPEELAAQGAMYIHSLLEQTPTRNLKNAE